MLPESMLQNAVEKLEDARKFIPVVHKADCIEDEKTRLRELEALSDEIMARNQEVFFRGVMNQAFPMYRQHGQRWFDYV